MLIESEHCDNCGKTYDAVYSVDDATWNQLAGSNMCLCPACADELARGKGLFPYWEMRHGEYPTQALKAENARLKEALRECYRSLCAYVDRDYREGGPLSAYDAEGAIAKAREVLGDA